MARYASRTQVSAAASRTEIERTLTRYGATQFGYAWDQNRAAIMFVLKGWHIRILLPMPDPHEHAVTHTPTGQVRSPEAQNREHAQAVRQRWRALALSVKAKLEAIDAEITTIENEFMPYVVLPDNRTLGEWVLPQLPRVYAEHEMPALLPDSEP